MVKKAGNLDGELRVRTSDKELKKFMKKSESAAGKPYPVFIREIITAFNEDRLRIVQPNAQKNTVYVTD